MAVVLITGCSSGFGLEAALAFAQRGDLTVATMRNLAKAEALRERAETAGVEVEIVQLDVNDEASVTSAVAGVIEQHGTVDVLVNNAGVGSRGAVETMSMESAHCLMDTNFWGPIRCSRAVLPAMRAQRSGVIVNVSSLSGRVPGTPYSSMYSASKSAINAVSESLATEVEPFGIRVVSIEPGFFDTAIGNNHLEGRIATHQGPGRLCGAGLGGSVRDCRRELSPDRPIRIAVLGLRRRISLETWVLGWA